MSAALIGAGMILVGAAVTITTDAPPRSRAGLGLAALGTLLVLADLVVTAVTR